MSEGPADDERGSGSEANEDRGGSATDDDPFYSPDADADEAVEPADSSAASDGTGDEPTPAVTAVEDTSAGDGAQTDDGPPVVDESAIPNIEETRCSNCGALIASDAARCPDCGRERDEQSSESTASGKDIEPLFSAVLSFLFPGIGHIYHGQSERGIVVFAGWVAWWLLIGLGFVLLTVVTLGIGALLIFFLPIVDLVYHVVAAADAYVQGEKIASGKKET